MVLNWVRVFFQFVFHSNVDSNPAPKFISWARILFVDWYRKEVVY